MSPSHPGVALAGRLLFTLIFFLSGVTHFTNLDEYVALMPAAIPFRPFWVVVSALVELAGAALIATDRSARLGGWLLVLFLVPVTITVHGVAMITAPDAATRAIQTSFFLKGLAMTGAALLVTQLGVGSHEVKAGVPESRRIRVGGSPGPARSASVVDTAPGSS